MKKFLLIQYYLLILQARYPGDEYATATSPDAEVTAAYAYSVAVCFIKKNMKILEPLAPTMKSFQSNSTPPAKHSISVEFDGFFSFPVVWVNKSRTAVNNIPTDSTRGP